MRIQIEQIKIKPGRREASPEHIEDLVKSIEEIGLLNPIIVDRSHTLIAGLHRLEAAKKLGWVEIECSVSSLEGLQKELAEIDENFVRRDISAVNLGNLLLRRKELYEALHPDTKHGGDRRSEDFKSHKGQLETPRTFVEDTAQKLGVATRTVHKQLQMARNLTPEAKDILRDTDVSKDNALKISRLPAEQQAEAAEMLTSGRIKRVEEYVSPKATDQPVEQALTKSEVMPRADDETAITPPNEAELPQVTSVSAASEPTSQVLPPSVDEAIEESPGGTGQNAALTDKLPSEKELRRDSPADLNQKVHAEADYHAEPDTQSSDPPFSLGEKTFATVRESIADLKDPNKDCSARPDTFLAEINGFVEKFEEEVDWFRNPYYHTALSRLSKVQFEYFTKRMEAICELVKQIILYVEGEWSKNG